ncbi:MAG: hypothetical protein HDR86_08945 [Bacteroides sp.]|nr:hypothetical protein [Bacteroides sp.]
MKKSLLALCAASMALGASAETFQLGEAFAYEINPEFHWFKADNQYCQDVVTTNEEGETINNPEAQYNINWPALAMEDEADLATNSGLGMIWFNAKRFATYEAADEYSPVVEDPWNRGAYAIKVQTETWDGFGNLMFALPKMNELCRIRTIFRVQTEDGECTWNNPEKPFHVRLTEAAQDECIPACTYQQENIKFWEEPGYRVVDQYYTPNGKTYCSITFDAGGLTCQRNVGFYLEEVSCVPVSKIAGDTHTENGVAAEVVAERPALTVIEGGEDSINEIGVAAQNSIYDLQGRKVAKAGKGLFIINGVKTLVK